jgi:hypothetical protein
VPRRGPEAGILRIKYDFHDLDGTESIHICFSRAYFFYTAFLQLKETPGRTRDTESQSCRLNTKRSCKLLRDNPRGHMIIAGGT